MTRMRPLRSVLGFVLFCGIFGSEGHSAPKPSPVELAGKARLALAENEKKYTAVLADYEGYSESGGEERLRKPRLRTHAEEVDGEAVTVYDGWDDQPPLSEKYTTGERIVNESKAIDPAALIKASLNSGVRRLQIAGVWAYGKRSVFLLESEPVGPGGLNLGRCAGPA